MAHSIKKRPVRFVQCWGRIFEVSRSLLDTFLSTIVTRSVSKEWQDNDSDEPIFIDRDGDIFRYCLAYMRDVQGVQLPLTESKAALLNDLTY